MKGQPVVCVDLDGTLAFYEDFKGSAEIGDPLPGAARFMERLHKEFEVVVYTTRCSLAKYDSDVTEADVRRPVENWLKQHRIPYDDIWTGQGKPHGIAYIDDKNIRVYKNEPWTQPSTQRVLDAVRVLWQEKRERLER